MAPAITKIQWKNSAWNVQKIYVSNNLDTVKDGLVVVDDHNKVWNPREPGKVHWVVVGEDHGGIPVCMSEAQSSPHFEDKLSIGSVVEQKDLKGCRLQFTLKQGSGPQTGWVNTMMDGAQLLVLDDEYEAYMKNRIVFSGGRWKSAPLPWVKWMPREDINSNYVWTQKGIDNLRPVNRQAGDKFTEKHLNATHSVEKRLGCSDLEQMGFIEIKSEEKKPELNYVFTAKGITAIFSSATHNAPNMLNEWGNPEEGSPFTAWHLSKIRQLAGSDDLNETTLVAQGLIAISDAESIAT